MSPATASSLRHMDKFSGLQVDFDAMQAEESAARFSKESIGIWFDADLAGLIADKIKEKIAGISTDELHKLVESYRTGFQALAAREVFMSPEEKVRLQKAIDLLPDDYETEYAATAEKLLSKFAAAGTKAKVEDVS